MREIRRRVEQMRARDARILDARAGSLIPMRGWPAVASRLLATLDVALDLLDDTGEPQACEGETPDGTRCTCKTPCPACQWNAGKAKLIKECRG